MAVKLQVLVCIIRFIFSISYVGTQTWRNSHQRCNLKPLFCCIPDPTYLKLRKNKCGKPGNFFLFHRFTWQSRNSPAWNGKLHIFSYSDKLCLLLLVLVTLWKSLSFLNPSQHGFSPFPFSPFPKLLTHGIILSLMLNSSCAHVEYHEAPPCPAIQPVQVTPNGQTAWWCVSHSSLVL